MDEQLIDQLAEKYVKEEILSGDIEFSEIAEFLMDQESLVSEEEAEDDEVIESVYDAVRDLIEYIRNTSFN